MQSKLKGLVHQADTLSVLLDMKNDDGDHDRSKQSRI